LGARIARCHYKNPQDDIFGDLHFTGPPPRPVAAFDESGLVITCGSISKTVALSYTIESAASPRFVTEITRTKGFSRSKYQLRQDVTMADNETFARIEELEAKLSQQDQAIIEMSEELFTQQKHLASIEAQVRHLSEKLNEVTSPAAGDTPDETPPHY
jgi:uncharacterized coiled-coil protein SlyX